MRWVAQPRQALFLSAREYAVLFGGARGGGKTDALLVHAIRVCAEHPGAKVLFLRRHFTELSQPGAAIPRSHELLGTHAAWHGSEHRWLFRGGSVLQFGHLQDQRALSHYLGTQVDALLIDQAEQLTLDEYVKLQGSVRATVDGLSPHIRLTANPGGPGHGWIKERFIDPAPPGEPFVWEADGVRAEHRYIPSKVWDNQELLRRDPGYVDRLRAMGGALARAWLEGDWDTFQGQYFDVWRRERHVVPAFAPPPAWTERAIAVDWGFGAPWACLFFARDADAWRQQRVRRWYAYRELYGPGISDEEQAKLIAAAVADDLRRAGQQRGALRWSMVAGLDLWNKDHTARGKSVADVYRDRLRHFGIVIRRANTDRVQGWRAVYAMLADQKDGRPGLLFMDCCPNAIRTIPALVRDAVKPEDIDSDGEDHAADATRYFVMSLGDAAWQVLHQAAPVALERGAAPAAGMPGSDELLRRVLV